MKKLQRTGKALAAYGNYYELQSALSSRTHLSVSDIAQ